MKKSLTTRGKVFYYTKTAMKYSAFLFVLVCSMASMTLAGESYGQRLLDKPVSVQLTNVTLGEALDRISREAAVQFVFVGTGSERRNTTNLRVDRQSLGIVLAKLLEPFGLSYQVVDNRIVIQSALASPMGKNEEITPVQPIGWKIQPSGIVVPELPRRIASPYVVPAPGTIRITGKVSDEKGDPLPGVNILIKGTHQGTTTDQEGSFQLTVQDNSAVLVFSFVGYVSQEVIVGNRTNLEVLMKVDDMALDELIVVGYGTQKKVNMTGAVDVISNEQIGNRQASTVSQILQGQSPGLDFSIGSAGFEPGASMNINIRGIGSLNGGSPFVLIDGFPGEMDRLNPNDIESVSILKDAAASAIYGARAPYGVILITTKSGKKNEKLTISYSGNISRNSSNRMPEMLDSYTFARVVNEMGDNAGGRPYSQAAVQRILAYQNKDWNYLKQFMPADAIYLETIPLPNGRWGQNENGYANYNWYDEFYGSSLNPNHNLSIQGGSDKTSYYLSAGFLSQEGILNYGVDYYKRYNLIGKVNTALKSWWDVRFETRFMKSPRERFTSNLAGQNGYDIMFTQVTRTVPTQAKYDGYGYYTIQSKIPFIEEGGTDRWATTENWQTVATEIRPLKGWKVNADFAYKSINIDRSNQNLTVQETYADGRVVPVAGTFPNNIEQVMHSDFYWASNIFTSYDLHLANHNLSLLTGLQYEFNKAHRVSTRKTNLIVPNVPSLQTANGDLTASESMSHWATQGYFGRFTYNFDEKYLFEANARYDGTSRFQKGNRWGFFPSFSLGWNLNRENFWKGISPYVNTFKIRGSWGQLGNQQVSPYQDLSLIPLQSGKLDWIFGHGNNRPVGYTSTPGLVSPNLTWETSTTINAGMNLAFLGNRLQFDFDLFERVTNNMIGPSESVPGVLGSASPRSNNATLSSKGWEWSLRWNHSPGKGDFSYFANLNMHDVKMVVKDYLNPSGLISDWYTGKEVGEIWGYTAHGLFKSQEELDAYRDNVDLSFIYNNWNPGDLKYEDINGDGKVNAGSNSLNDHGDLSIIGNNTPRYQFGISAGLNYKGFDLSFLIRGTLKRDYAVPQGNVQLRYWGVESWLWTGLTPQHLDYFRDRPGDEFSGLYEGDANINLDAFWPKPYLNNAQNGKNRHPSTRYLANASYVRLQNVQLGYSFPGNILSKIKLQKLRVYFSGENLLTKTKLLRGIDPVALIGVEGGIGVTYGADQMLSFGFTATF